ncbi:YfcC family protein [Alteribacillus sp. YIM 98480]|uniref:YfcC family protein n=1 Tax=Alteribacillus sp. YIM 98480 TaxID=2606599 RepID=UPI0018EF0340|nr:AbgT family transporter [Alteribacillus sp. YIM 98480]
MDKASLSKEKAIQEPPVQEPRKNKRWVMPDVFVILFIFLLLAFAASYVLPSGAFEREESNGITQIVPDSFQYLAADPISFMDIFVAIQQGFIGSAGIIFLILVMGGVVKVIESTGAINSGIHNLIQRTKGNQYLLIFSFCGTFALLSTIGIAPNLAIAFVPIGLLLARSLGLDPLIGVAMVFLGAYSGFSAGIFDPSVTVIGQTIAELPLFSGLLFRVAIFVVFVIVTILYICRYAEKVRKNPSNSIMGVDSFTNQSKEEDTRNKDLTFSRKHKITIMLFFLSIGIYLYGAFTYQWALNELTAVFLMLSICIAIVARITPNDFIQRFMSGASAVLYGAMVVGMARSVIILLEDGQIIDTIVYGVSSGLESTSPLVGMQLLYIFNFIFNGLITSASGQAAIVMPIMVPIADMMEVTRQSAFITFKLGDAVTNIITPLSGTLMACLAIGKVSYGHWLKFVFPLLLIWLVIGALFVATAQLINYGPY